MAAHHDALIHTMVLASAADRDMTDAELLRIGDIVKTLPVFRGYGSEQVTRAAEACATALQGKNGLDRVIEGITEALPERLRETSYALACDVVAADGRASQEELRLLEYLRDSLGIDHLAAAAIERAARARFATV